MTQCFCCDPVWTLCDPCVTLSCVSDRWLPLWGLGTVYGNRRVVCWYTVRVYVVGPVAANPTGSGATISVVLDKSDKANGLNAERQGPGMH